VESASEFCIVGEFEVESTKEDELMEANEIAEIVG
jgi:hypothetical protein